jgi:5-methylcytosine-specific restriction endonuclease McrA
MFEKHSLFVCDKPVRASFSEWVRLRQIILDRDRVCVECGSTVDLELDHVKPLSLGGDDSLDNLQLLCRVCHLDKTRRDVSYWSRLQKVKKVSRKHKFGFD